MNNIAPRSEGQAVCGMEVVAVSGAASEGPPGSPDERPTEDIGGASCVQDLAEEALARDAWSLPSSYACATSPRPRPDLRVGLTA